MIGYVLYYDKKIASNLIKKRNFSDGTFDFTVKRVKEKELTQNKNIYNKEKSNKISPKNLSKPRKLQKNIILQKSKHTERIQKQFKFKSKNNSESENSSSNSSSSPNSSNKIDYSSSLDKMMQNNLTQKRQMNHSEYHYNS